MARVKVQSMCRFRATLIYKVDSVATSCSKRFRTSVSRMVGGVGIMGLFISFVQLESMLTEFGIYDPYSSPCPLLIVNVSLTSIGCF